MFIGESAEIQERTRHALRDVIDERQAVVVTMQRSLHMGIPEIAAYTQIPEPEVRQLAIDGLIALKNQVFGK